MILKVSPSSAFVGFASFWLDRSSSSWALRESEVFARVKIKRKDLTDGSNSILQIVRLDGGETDLGQEKNTEVLGDNLGLVASLARNALIELYFQRKCEILDFRPIEVVSRSSQQNFLTTVLPNEGIPQLLSIRQLCEIDVRVFLNSGRPFLGIVLNLRMRRRLRCSCDELLKSGLDLSGLKVSALKPGSDPRVEPKGSFLIPPSERYV